MRYVPIINLLDYSIKDLKTGKVYEIWKEIICIDTKFKVSGGKKTSTIIENIFSEIINDLNLFEDKQLGFESIRHKSYILDILKDVIIFEIGIDKFLNTFDENISKDNLYGEELRTNATKIKDNLDTLITWYF